MTTESLVRYLGDGEARMWSPVNEVVPPTNELQLILKGHGFHGNSRDGPPGRSGSAPPCIEGSLAALGNYSGLQQSNFDTSLSSENSKLRQAEEQLCADPSYVAYYLSNVNLNPRLPPPIKSRENCHLVQHIGRSRGNLRLVPFDDNNGGYYLPSQTHLSTHEEEVEDDDYPAHDSSSSSSKNTRVLSCEYLSSQDRHESPVDRIQEDFHRTSSPVFNNRPCLPSHELRENLVSSGALENSQQDSSKFSEMVSPTSNTSQTKDSVWPVLNGDFSSVSVHRMPSPENLLGQHVSPIRESSIERKTLGTNIDCSSIGNMNSEMRNLNISNGKRNQHHRQYLQKKNSNPGASATPSHSPVIRTIPHSQAVDRSHNEFNQFPPGQSETSPSANAMAAFPTTGYSVPLFCEATGYINLENTLYSNFQSSNLFSPPYSIGNYAVNASIAPPLIASFPTPGAIPMALDNTINLNFNATGRNLLSDIYWQHPYKLYGQVGTPTQPSFVDSNYLTYFLQHSTNVYTCGNYDSTSHNFDLQKGNSAPLSPSDHRSSYLMKRDVCSTSYYRNQQDMGIFMQYPPSSLGSLQIPGSPISGGILPIRNDNNIRLPVSSGKNDGPYSGWQGRRGHERVDDSKNFSFLEQLKSSKTRRFELSDISGRVVEFSTDQHGSRFIQQKLENCTVEEKACVFGEVLPHASILMTDVFGNYVIQKFLEHGNAEQRKELANKLVGHVLRLSLQMYGCRVIQKALEVIDDEHKSRLVRELDGHVMRCVRDQNGNHVVQKCIEHMPSKRIGFIITAFRGQVATLSTHPYGCRVIQRVLEHCTDKLQSQCVVDEILESACFLAQDQYGNYVTQHVLEKGSPQERSQVISKLAGQIVQMSQNKFASNVIEKCLEHGDHVERELLIDEVVGQTEGNEDLLVMMKDQYANYVIQKILETCNDKQREILLTRIKIHGEALKKYTYGKHIIARVEQYFGEGLH